MAEHVTSAWDAAGFRFRLRSDDGELAAHMAGLFSGLSVYDGAESVYDLTIQLAAESPPGEAVNAAVGTVNLGVVFAAAGDLLVHAGAVSRRHGGTAVLCGPSGSGKSTLTARLVGRGLAYVTDETACVAPDTLHITAFRKPLSIKPGSHEVLSHLAPEVRAVERGWSGPTWLVPPAEIGDVGLPDAVLHPELIVFPAWSRTARTEIESVHPGEAAYLIGEHSSRLRDVAGGPLPALARLARRAPAYRIRYSDLDAAADAVIELWDAA